MYWSRECFICRWNTPTHSTITHHISTEWYITITIQSNPNNVFDQKSPIAFDHVLDPVPIINGFPDVSNSYITCARKVLSVEHFTVVHKTLEHNKLPPRIAITA